MDFYFEVAPLKIVRTNSEVFTYASKEKLETGQIIQIPVGKKNMFGVVFKEVEKPDFETREILKIVEKTPIPKHLIELSKWMSQYYATPLSQVLSGILPAGLGKNRRSSKKEKINLTDEKESCSNFLYTNQQQNAINKLDKIHSGTVLLHGITGSGKTSIYINQTEKVLANQQSAIILVPEIALTSQLVLNFEKHFSNIKIIHSHQTEAERHKTWLKILNDSEPQVIIGARSALFAPVKNLGLIVIDECHEPSFKQDQTPKYSALRASSFLASNFNFKAIFGSATPLIEDYFLAELSEKNGGNEIIRLTELAKKEAQPAKIKLVDLTKKDSKNHRFFSKKMLFIVNFLL